MRKDDANRLRHMRDAGREALEFARSRVRSDLDTDRMLVLALIKDIEIIGEAAKIGGRACLIAICEGFDNPGQTRATSSPEFNYFLSEKPNLLLFTVVGFCLCAGN